MNKLCSICNGQIEPGQDTHEIGGPGDGDKFYIAHEVCHWKSTAGMLVHKLAQIEATISNGNKIVGILAGLWIDLIEYAEMGANWAITNQIETDVKKIEFLTRRVNEAKKITAQFKAETEAARKAAANRDQNNKPHICLPGCKH